MNHIKFLQAIAKRDYDGLLHDGGYDLTKEQLETVIRMSQEDSALELQRKGAQVASTPGYREFMTTPIMSQVGASEGFGKVGKRTAVRDKPKSAPKETKRDNKDPSFTNVGPKATQNLRVGDTEADVLGKLYNFLQRKSEFDKKRYSDNMKYQKEVAANKEQQLEDIIAALEGRQPGKVKVKKSSVSSSSGLKKLLGIGALGIGGMLLSKGALASIETPNFKKMFPPIGDLVKSKESPDDWKKDTEFLQDVQSYANQKGIKTSDLLGVMSAETGGTFDPSIKNKSSGATGLIQFMPSTAKDLGTTTEELSKMNRKEQFQYVKKYLDKQGLKFGATGGEIYTKVFLPARSGSEVLTREGESFYEANKSALDVGKKGYISQSDLGGIVQQKVAKGGLSQFDDGRLSASKDPRVSIEARGDVEREQMLDNMNKQWLDVMDTLEDLDKSIDNYFVNYSKNVVNNNKTLAISVPQTNNEPSILDKTYNYGQ